MGTWGPGIHSDDDACDIREEVRDLVADGLPASEIEERIFRNYTPDGPYRQAIATLTLAIRLHKYGRLPLNLRDRAVAVIDDGSAIGEWAGHRDESKRIAALAKARDLLMSDQPAPKVVRKPTVYECPWAAGDIVAYALPSGNLFVFVVRQVHRDKGGTYPTIVPIWSGAELPGDDHLLNAPTLPASIDYVRTFNKRIDPDGPYFPMISEICLLRIPNKTPARFRSLGLTRPMERRITSGNAVAFKNLDAYIEKVFRLT